LIRGLSEKHSGLDVLINNARSGDRTIPLEETYENIQLTAGVTLFSPMLLSQSFINCIDKTEIKKNRSIVNISSVAAGFAGSESLAYHTAKSGLEGMTRYLAKHGGEKGVRVNAIRPGFIVQDEYIDRYMHDNNTYYRKKAENAHPTGYVGTNNDVAMLALFLTNKASQFITGQTITVDGGLTIQDQWDLMVKSPCTNNV